MSTLTRPPFIFFTDTFFKKWVSKMSPESWAVFCGLKMYASEATRGTLGGLSETCGLPLVAVERALQELRTLQLLYAHGDLVTLREPGSLLIDGWIFMEEEEVAG